MRISDWSADVCSSDLQMKKLQPEMMRLRERYGDDKAKMNQELMALYKKEKITPAGRKVFMLQYRTNAGERRKPALGQYGELTVVQARTMAQEWLAEEIGRASGGDTGGQAV